MLYLCVRLLTKMGCEPILQWSICCCIALAATVDQEVPNTIFRENYCFLRQGVLETVQNT